MIIIVTADPIDERDTARIAVWFKLMFLKEAMLADRHSVDRSMFATPNTHLWVYMPAKDISGNPRVYLRKTTSP